MAMLGQLSPNSNQLIPGSRLDFLQHSPTPI